MKCFVLVGLSRPGRIELRSGLNRLGRNPTNDWRISDASVSSFHCEITVGESRVAVQDLCSTNGTFIDGTQVKEGQIEHGGILRLGAAEFRLEEVQIAIPEVTVEQLPTPSTTATGAPACLQHPGLPAAFRCDHCQHTFCADCVKGLRLAGGEPKFFCPRCSGQCVACIDQASPPQTPATFLGRLTQTIRIRLK
jgi:pSer/pThr/pTyr-binding forkhead associated (FHA) protein